MELVARHQGLGRRQATSAVGGHRQDRASGHGPLSSPCQFRPSQTYPKRCARRPPPTQNIKAADGPHQASGHPPAASTEDRHRIRLSGQRTRPSREPRPTPRPGPEHEIATHLWHLLSGHWRCFSSLSAAGVRSGRTCQSADDRLRRWILDSWPLPLRSNSATRSHPWEWWSADGSYKARPFRTPSSGKRLVNGVGRSIVWPGVGGRGSGHSNWHESQTTYFDGEAQP